MHKINYSAREYKMDKIRTQDGVKWEETVGYSRAIKAGNIIEIAGTAAVDKDKIIGENDPYGQTEFIIQKIIRNLNELGATLQDVVRTRIFVTDITKWEEIGKAHGKYFKEIKPVTTMVEVSNLIDPKLLVEIEATAILNESQ